MYIEDVVCDVVISDLIWFCCGDEMCVGGIGIVFFGSGDYFWRNIDVKIRIVLFVGL